MYTEQLQKQELQTQDLGANLARLKKYNAMRRLKAATNAVIAVRRLSVMFAENDTSNDTPDSAEEARGPELSPVKTIKA